LTSDVGTPAGLAAFLTERALVTRRETGPPVLLLYAFPETSLMWRKIAPALGADYTVNPDGRLWADRDEGMSTADDERIKPIGCMLDIPHLQMIERGGARRRAPQA
jgi:hypothetical protein